MTKLNDDTVVKEKKERPPLSYDIDTEFGDNIIEEGPNTCIMMRKINWNDRGYKLDIRKYAFHDKEEVMMKGISMTDAGANELTHELVKHGYGETSKIIDYIKQRSDFNEAMLAPIDTNASNSTDNNFYDPKQLLNITEEEDGGE